MTLELAIRLYFFLNLCITWVFWTTGGAGDIKDFKKSDYVIFTAFGFLFGTPALTMGLFCMLVHKLDK